MGSLVRKSVSRSAVSIAFLSLVGCSTATPVLIEGVRTAGLRGRANTSAGYTGEITTETGQCRGSFTGALGVSAAPLEMSCRDGRRGVGTAIIENGYFVSGEARMSDGSRLVVRATGPGFP